MIIIHVYLLKLVRNVLYLRFFKGPCLLCFGLMIEYHNVYGFFTRFPRPWFFWRQFPRQWHFFPIRHDTGRMAGVTGRQRMLILLWHLILLHFLKVLICSAPGLLFPFAPWTLFVITTRNSSVFLNYVYESRHVHNIKHKN